MKRLRAGFLWGRNSQVLAPSASAIGPNTYLTAQDFLKMLALAFVVHALVFGVAALFPNDHVTHIPVRALSFKLGGGERMSATVPAPTRPAVAPPVLQATTQTWQATPNMPPPEVPAPLKPVAKPVPKPTAAPVKQPKVYKVVEPAKPAEPVSAPKQYVREVGAAPTAIPSSATDGQGSVSAINEAALQAVRARYEQDISGWIQRHKFYPAEAGGREGRVVVRMRIDRLGNVRYYAIEQSSGLTALDAAALDMIRRANPVPAVPENYPAGNLVEFLIPISFKAPQ